MNAKSVRIPVLQGREDVKVSVLRSFGTRCRITRQRGNALIYASVAAALFTFWLSSWQVVQQDQRVRTSGGAESTGAQVIAAAAATYAQENYGSLQPTPALAVTRNGFTLAAANALTPSVADLNSLGYLTAVAGTASSRPGNWRITMQRTPAGCVTTACDIQGLLWLDTPVTVPNGEIDGTWIAGFMSKGNNNAGFANTVTPAVIQGPGWNFPNPDPTQRAGIVAIRFGFGASGLGQFVRVNENRAVTFTNNFAAGNTTVNGTITSTGGVTVGTPGCTRVQLTPAGQVLVNDPACVSKLSLDSSSGAGVITSLNSAGAVSAGIRYDGTGVASTVYGDNLQNNAGTAQLRSDGTVVSNALVINGLAVPGSACTTANQVMRGNLAGQPVLMICSGGTWQLASGDAIGTIGGACTLNGRSAITAAGVSLICSNLQWVATTDRMGRWAVATTLMAGHNSNVPKPACPGGGTPLVFAIPQAIDSTSLYTNFGASDLGISWRIAITNGAGVPLSGQGLVQTGCWYL